MISIQHGQYEPYIGSYETVAVCVSKIVRLGRIFKIHLGQEFLYSFSKNWLPRIFLGVELIKKVLHREKCPVFLLSRLFQDGRHRTETSQL